MSAVGAVLEVYDGLETAALVLLGDTAETTASLLHHKYGQEVGAAAVDGTCCSVLCAVCCVRCAVCCPVSCAVLS